jgi:hypothetical protein
MAMTPSWRAPRGQAWFEFRSIALARKVNPPRAVRIELSPL